MKRNLLMASVILLAAVVACSTLSTSADYNRSTDFSKYRTWAWRDQGTIKDPLVAQRVETAVANELGKKGLTRTDADPDLWVVAHGTLSQQTQVDYYNSGWGYGWGWGGGTGMSTATVRQIPVGTLVIDLADARAKELVWRGTASDTLKEKATPEERAKILAEAMAKLFADYPPPKPM
jgi:hypothetical protein